MHTHQAVNFIQRTESVKEKEQVLKKTKKKTYLFIFSKSVYIHKLVSFVRFRSGLLAGFARALCRFDSYTLLIGLIFISFSIGHLGVAFLMRHSYNVVVWANKLNIFFLLNLMCVYVCV